MTHLAIFIGGLILPFVGGLVFVVIRNKFRNPVCESFEEEDGWTP